MPWLVGTALVHSLAATEKRGVLKAWTVLLAIFAFSLSLLGTFLVRSGVLTSVHAFATDPARGVFILIFLGIVVGGSLLLYALRAPSVRSAVGFDVVSRETALLVNNLLLVVAAASILLGTLYPIAVDALGIGKISVGPPYFNSVFVPLTAPLAALVGIGALARWKRDRLTRLARRLGWAFAASIVIGAIGILLLPHFSAGALLGITLAAWVALSTAQAVRERVAGKPSLWRALRSTPAGFYGMALAHLGIAVFVTGITLTSVYSTEKDVRMAPGDKLELGGYTFEFRGVRDVQGANYLAREGTVRVTHGGDEVAVLAPQKRVYRVQRSPMTEAAIDAGLLRDLFVALGDPVGPGDAWTLRVYHKPFIRWIWFGALLMGAGGLVAVADRRYRSLRRRAVQRDVEPGAQPDAEPGAVST
jgi:cytochrome c-type biogenesis protein CcmF